MKITSGSEKQIAWAQKILDEKIIEWALIKEKVFSENEICDSEINESAEMFTNSYGENVAAENCRDFNTKLISKWIEAIEAYINDKTTAEFWIQNKDYSISKMYIQNTRAYRNDDLIEDYFMIAINATRRELWKPKV